MKILHWAGFFIRRIRMRINYIGVFIYGLSGIWFGCIGLEVVAIMCIILLMETASHSLKDKIIQMLEERIFMLEKFRAK